MSPRQMFALAAAVSLVIATLFGSIILLVLAVPHHPAPACTQGIERIYPRIGTEGMETLVVCRGGRVIRSAP